MHPADITITKTTRRAGVPQSCVFRLVAECPFTGRLAVLYTQTEPTGADCAAVLKKLREG